MRRAGRCITAIVRIGRLQTMLRGPTSCQHGPLLSYFPRLRFLAVPRRCGNPAFSTDSAVSIYSLASLDKPAHHATAAEWADNFKQVGVRAIPKDAYEITMSRSSGPGGQVRGMFSATLCRAEISLACSERQQAQHQSGFEMSASQRQHSYR
jgi:hypothetical protein